MICSKTDPSFRVISVLSRIVQMAVLQTGTPILHSADVVLHAAEGERSFRATFPLCPTVTNESNQKAAKVENGRNKFARVLGRLLHTPSAVARGTKHRVVHPPALHPATPGKSSSAPNFGCLSKAAPARR